MLLCMNRRRFSALLVGIFTSALTTAFAQTAPAKAADPNAQPKGFTSVEVLWPEGAPGAAGKADADVPKLYCFPAPGAGPHTAVVVLPGGGYTHVVMEKEGGVEA